MEMELKKLRDPGACRLKNLHIQICSNHSLKQNDMFYYFNTLEDELNTLFYFASFD